MKATRCLGRLRLVICCCSPFLAFANLVAVTTAPSIATADLSQISGGACEKCSFNSADCNGEECDENETEEGVFVKVVGTGQTAAVCTSEGGNRTECDTDSPGDCKTAQSCDEPECTNCDAGATSKVDTNCNQGGSTCG